MKRRSQAVWLAGQHIGHLTSTSRETVAFEYTDEVLEHWPMNTPLLSCSLPVRPGRHSTRAFFAGLLPEGDHRRFLAQQAHCLPTDVFALLDRFGQDVAGAVVVGEAVATRPVARREAYSEAELAAEVDGLLDRPLAVHDDSELSLPGLQDKMLLVRTDDGGWARPVHGYPSSHILKIDDRRHPGLVHAEHTALTIARAAGISAAASRLERIGALDCIVVERFDREPGNPPLRIHQEDACQALGLDLEALAGRAKYEADGGPSLRQIARLLQEWAADPREELLRLLDQVTFTVAIGDADAHGKNISVLHPEPGRIGLSPLYDTVPTGLWPNLRKRAAMSIGGAVDLPDVTLDDILNEARRWGLPERQGRQRVEGTLDRIADACRSVDNVGPHDVVGATAARVDELRDNVGR